MTSEWTLTQLTHGSERGLCHSHAYYDIPVFSPDSGMIVGHQVTFTERHPEPSDSIGIGVIDLDGSREWEPIGQSTAWSWQQGAMSQFVPQGRSVIWNDRRGQNFIARRRDLPTGEEREYDRPVYALHPDGRSALSLNMARLEEMRPGYGYAGGSGGLLDERHPGSDGVWRLDLENGSTGLVLSLDTAVRFLMSRLSLKERLRHRAMRYTYWFNHVKYSPDGSRFTVKLRFARRGGHWDDRQGVSLTCGTDGADLGLLANATSHVIWLDDERLYFFRRDGVYIYRDTAPEGQTIAQIAPDLLGSNVHLRHFGREPRLFVFDTPYRETIDLVLLEPESGEHSRIAQFANHRPARGPFRCDLHPVPSPDGQRILVTSLDDGGRQIYLLERATA